jgi:GT2 family glycosyltransferase/glycosyltransferase involved in cell wall biosynthesis
MSDQKTINSNEYWDKRFETDWDKLGGREQSRFFARIAVEALPQWFAQKVRHEKLRVCDFGCAEGDGTDVLAQVLAWDVTGIDFSRSAIENASATYHSAGFSHENLLERPERPSFDVMFSSNTLEHFARPWDVFDAISHYASKYVVLLLPYREFERHSEHEVTFDAPNIPLSPKPEWTLVYESVVDARLHQPSYWPGFQILLIYARSEEMRTLPMTMSDARINGMNGADHTVAELRVNKKRADEFQAQSEADKSRADEAAAALEEVKSTAHDAQLGLTHASAHLATLSLRCDALRDKLQQLTETHASQVETFEQRHDEDTKELEAAAQRAAKVADELTAYIHFLRQREQALQNEVDLMLRSRSWRWSAPLRMVLKVPAWLRARMDDVNYAYTNGGVLNAAQRSLSYLPKRFRRRADAEAAPGTPAASDTAPAATVSEPVVAIAQVAPMLPRLPRQRPGDLPDVFVFSIIDWHFRIQRPQHLSRELAQAGHRVYFFTNYFEDATEPGFSVERLDDSLPLYQIKLKVKGAPQIYFAPPDEDAARQLRAGIRMFMDWTGTDRSWSIVQHAYWYPVAASLHSDDLLYDCMDHHEGFGNVSQELITVENQLMRSADLLIATSAFLEKEARERNPRVAVIRNACQYSDFCDAPAERFVDPKGRRIIGYYGAIADWFDADLVARVAESFPDALVLLVGADTAGVRERLAQYDNVQMTGEVRYVELPYYLYAFDVCMMPFQVIPLTLATNPVKIYEYLAAGRPVVSVDLPEMVQFGELVRTATTYEGFIDQVRGALAALPDSKEVVARRKAFAAGQTWSHRVEDIRQAVQALPRPTVSAIVLTYNNIHLTMDCLESLVRNTDGVALEIVIVDNASSDGSRAFLSTWAAAHSNVKLILNDSNLGFAGGNNVGLAAATGDYLAILNNDTVVTRGWALRLINHLRHNPEIGVIGPVTNNIGNEARLTTHYRGIDEMHLEARSLTNPYRGEWFELSVAAFFCVMMPRSTYERCGPISEDYGVGFYEDDDYCRLVESVGLRVACAEDVFVHHYLSASFNKLGEERKLALLATNRAVYEAKWGPWTPHKFRERGNVERAAV